MTETSRYGQPGKALQFIFDFSGGQPGRNAWVDYAKGIAIIFVVYRHVVFGLLYSGETINHLMMDANEMLYGFRMPLFFFLSGLFYAGSMKKRGGGNYLISRINTLLYPYILWCVIQLTLQITFADLTNSKHTVSSYINILLYPRTLLQLWYLFALFNVSVLYLFTNHVLKFSPYFQIGLGIVLLAAHPLAGNFSVLSDIMQHYIFFAIGHIAAPVFFREKTQQYLTSGSKVLLLLPVFFVVQYICMIYSDMNIILYSALAMLGGLIVIMISFMLERSNRLKLLRILGSYSLYIYLLHIGIIFLLRSVFVSSGIITNIPLATFLLVTFGILMSIILYRICLLLRLGFLFKGPFKESGKMRGSEYQNNPANT